MSSTDDYRPRLSIELTEEQRQRLADINLPHGWQRAMFSAIIDDVLWLHDNFGVNALACIVSRIGKPSEILPTMAAANSREKITKGGDNNG